MKTTRFISAKTFAPLANQAKGESDRARLEAFERMDGPRAMIELSSSFCTECGATKREDSTCAACERELEILASKANECLKNWIASGYDVALTTK